MCTRCLCQDECVELQKKIELEWVYIRENLWVAIVAENIKECY